MRRASDLIGKSIVSGDRGEKLGTVADVLVEPERGRVAGLVVRTGVLRGERVLPYDQVQALGGDAVVARSHDATVGPDAWKARHLQTRRSTRLKNRRVITRSGRQLGTVSDVYVDETSGALSGYEVSRRGFGGVVRHHTTLRYSTELTVGDDALVVPDEIEEAIAASDRAGG